MKLLKKYKKYILWLLIILLIWYIWKNLIKVIYPSESEWWLWWWACSKSSPEYCNAVGRYLFFWFFSIPKKSSAIKDDSWILT